MNRLKTLAFALVIAVLGVSLFAITQPEIAYAATSKDAACAGIGITGPNCGSGAGGRITSLVSTIVDLLSWIVGIAAVIMIIIAGFKYITSSGDSNSVASAKNTLIWAIVGIVIVALAQVIVRLVLEETAKI